MREENGMPQTDRRSKGFINGLRPTTEEGTNPKDQFGVEKVPLALIPGTAQVLQAMCMGDGAEKYGPYNYRVSKVQALIYLEAVLRHVHALIDGEDFDSMTGYPHIGYVMATASIYADAWVNGFLIDNRPVPGMTPELMALYNHIPGQPRKTAEELKAGLLKLIQGS
jgi:hypothetical protein